MTKHFIYCPYCKNKLKKSNHFYQCNLCNEKIYINSSPCVGFIPVRKNKILLSVRKAEPFKGGMDIIGGFLENGEGPEEGAIREVKEETGGKATIKKMIGIYTDTYGPNGKKTLNIHYAGTIKGKLKPMDDVEKLVWVDIKDTKNLHTFDNVREALSDLRKTLK